MAIPAFEAAGAYLNGSAASAAIAVPAGTAAGKVVLATMYLDGAALAVDPTVPAGFELAEGAPVQILSGSGSHSLYVWWKRLTGSDSGTYDFVWSGSKYREAVATLWTDVVATGNPFDSPTDTASDLASANITPPVEITTAGPDRLLVWSATCWAGGTWTPHAGFTKRVQAGFGLFTVADMSQATAGASGAVTGSCSGADKRNVWMGALIGTTSGDTPIALADSATAAETAIATVATVAADSATSEQAIAITAASSAADAGSAVDVLAVAAAVSLVDAGAVTDALAVTALVGLVDAAAAADSLEHSQLVSLTDAGAGADALAATAAAVLGDEAAAIEALGAAVDAVLADAGVALDAVAISGPPPEISVGTMSARDRTGAAMAHTVRRGTEMRES